MEALNPIEQTYRQLLSEGKTITKLCEIYPEQCGFEYPTQTLSQTYLNYINKPYYTPDPRGLLKAREAICDYYASTGFDLSPDQIRLTAGTSESFLYLFSLLCQPGEAVLVPQPSYPLFESIASIARIRLIPYTLDPDNQYQPDVRSIERTLTESIKAIILISPHNPTGSIVSTQSLFEITHLANKHGLALICDEVFSEFVFDNKTYPRLAQVAKPDLCFTLNGISKLLALPAFKLGWLVISGKADLVASVGDKLDHIIDTFLSCHTAIQEALPELLEARFDFLPRYKKQIELRKNLAVQTLNRSSQIKVVNPQGGFYLTFEFPNYHLNDEELALKLLKEKHIFIHPGYFFDFKGEYFGLISFLHETSLLEQSLQRIVQLIEK